MQEMLVQSLDQEDSLEKEMVTHSSILAWEIPWTEEPGGLYSLWGCKESDMTEGLTLSLFFHPEITPSDDLLSCSPPPTLLWSKDPCSSSPANDLSTSENNC